MKFFTIFAAIATVAVARPMSNVWTLQEINDALMSPHLNPNVKPLLIDSTSPLVDIVINVNEKPKHVQETSPELNPELSPEPSPEPNPEPAPVPNPEPIPEGNPEPAPEPNPEPESHPSENSAEENPIDIGIAIEEVDDADVDVGPM